MLFFRVVSEKKCASERLTEVNANFEEIDRQLQTEKEKRIKIVNDLKKQLESSQMKLNCK